MSALPWTRTPTRCAGVSLASAFSGVFTRSFALKWAANVRVQNCKCFIIECYAHGALFLLTGSIMESLLDMNAELQDLAAIEAEAIGWLPLGDHAYLHVGRQEEPAVNVVTVVAVVGVMDAAMAGAHVLWVG